MCRKKEEGELWVSDALFTAYRNAYRDAKVTGRYAKNKNQSNFASLLTEDETTATLSSPSIVIAEVGGPTTSFPPSNSQKFSSPRGESQSSSSSPRMHATSSTPRPVNSSTSPPRPASSPTKKKPGNVSSFQEQRLKELLDPIQPVLEKILIRYGYPYHGRKLQPSPYETDLDQENVFRALSSALPKILLRRLDNMQLNAVSASINNTLLLSVILS